MKRWCKLKKKIVKMKYVISVLGAIITEKEEKELWQLREKRSMRKIPLKTSNGLFNIFINNNNILNTAI